MLCVVGPPAELTMASRDHTDREWRDAIDQKLIEFWREHECLFDSSKACYHNKKLKSQLWAEFASSMGLNASDVERRCRSLRTQYGRLIRRPEKVTTKKKRMLKEQLSFLRPYIVPRRVTDAQDENYEEEEEDADDDEEEEEEEEETEDSIETGSVFGSPLHTVAFGPDPTTHEPVALTPSAVTRVTAGGSGGSHCPPPPPHITDITSLSCSCQQDEIPPEQAGDGPTHDILSQFVKVILSDMHQIKDSMVLMRLRRDITDLVFKAVEEDVQRRRV